MRLRELSPSLLARRSVPLARGRARDERQPARKDRTKAMGNGLLDVANATRSMWLSEKSPDWGEAAPFDFETMCDTVRHPKPQRLLSPRGGSRHCRTGG